MSNLPICRSSLFLILSTAPIIDRYCCVRCAPRRAEFCCDLCHPEHFTAHLNVSPYKKPPRRVNKCKTQLFAMSADEQNLRVALIQMRHELAAEHLSKHSFIAPQALMSTALLDRIVALAHERKLPTIDSLRDQIPWAFLDSHGPRVMELVNTHIPAPLPSLFTTVPLAPRPAVSNTSAACLAVPKTSTGRQNHCGSCGGYGHNSKSILGSRKTLLITKLFYRTNLYTRHLWRPRKHGTFLILQ